MAYIQSMDLISECIDYSLYPKRIWLKPSWASVVFEDDWGDGCYARHLDRGTLETLLEIVSDLGEKHVAFSDPNLLQYSEKLELSKLDEIQLSSSAFLIVGGLGWGICGTGDDWCAVAGKREIMAPFIDSCGGFSQIRDSYPVSETTLEAHKEFLRNNFKNYKTKL